MIRMRKPFEDPLENPQHEEPAIPNPASDCGPDTTERTLKALGYEQKCQTVDIPFLELSELLHAYLTTAVWTDQESLEEDSKDGKIGDFSLEMFQKSADDCLAFYTKARDMIVAVWNEVRCGPDFGPLGRTGHDLWLTRNGHGCGFWDGDWPDPEGDKLTELSKELGEVWIYVGDDNLIYVTR